MNRSIAAVLVGFAFIAALSFGADALVRRSVPGAFDAAGHTASVPVLLLTIGYVGLFATAGCYLAARIAPDRPMRHAMVLGLMGLTFNLAATSALWSTAPAWYHLTSLALVLPYAWAGGRLRQLELRRAAAAGTATRPALS